MRQQPLLFLLFFSLFILSVDFYAYRGIKKLISGKKPVFQRWIWIGFWFVPFILIIGLILFNIFSGKISPQNIMINAHYLSGTFILFYVPKLIFIIFNLLDDLILLIKKFLSKQRRDDQFPERPIEPLRRRQFLTRTGIVLAGIPFVSIAYGIQWGRFNFSIRNLKLSYPNLPVEFDGFRVLQISDFHIGSFLNSVNKVQEVVDLINKQDADLLLFTGDMVNHVASEIDDFIEPLKTLKAHIGKFSILGNHDYGDYVRWKSKTEKQKNFEKLLSRQQEIGLDLLLNEARKIAVGNDQIELIGVENWGFPPFPQYGNLDKALADTEKNSFKILLSHDPSHWAAEVLGKTSIDLTLSGHTHGAQFGINIPGWRWSPVNMRYKHWGGLYTEGDQKLYVNVGLGFIGFPGRVGMPPEITVIELKKA